MNDAVTRITAGAHLRAAFDAAVELEPAARAAWLAANVPDASERAQIERLLAADAGEGFLDLPATQQAARLAAEELDTRGLIGQRIGAFRIVAELGQGGMSAVFLGERVGADFTQKVAVKLLRRGLYSEVEQRLFQRERRALAALDHANVARLIDGGVTAAGIPFLVMEYVDGVTLLRYAQTQALDLRERLALFETVCRAVAAAHRALIVHRDIKPSNILVGVDGTVKLLDFGIAKLMADDTDTTQAPGTVGVFTPGYAAPEQLESGAITTATDVYGLGVVLHELLLGVRPLGSPTRRPSSLLGTRGATAPSAIGTVLPAAPARLRHLLRGDLDNVLLKALATEPSQRYPSAHELADDIERYLDDKPVRAHPPSRLYRARKFVQRHRGGVALTTLFVLGIVGALALALWQAQIARREAQRANATRDFMVDLFQTASADLPRDQRPTPQQLVDEAAKRAREDPDLAAPVRAELLFTLGKVALANGEYTRADSLLDDAIARSRALGMAADSPEWIELLVQKGNLLQRLGLSGDADRLMLEIEPTLLAQDSEAAVSGLMLLGATQASAEKPDAAVAIGRAATAKAARVFGADSIDGLSTATFFGQLCVQLRRYRDAVALLDPALARWRALDLQKDEQFGRTLVHLASAKEQLGERAAAAALYREAIDLMRSIFDKPHDRLATALGAYGRFLIGEEQFAQAKELLDAALAMDRSVLGADHVRTAQLMDFSAQLALAEHDAGAAEALTREAVRVFVAHAEEAGYVPELMQARLHHASALLALGRREEASAEIAALPRTLPASLGADSPETIESLRLQGAIALAGGDAAAALRDAEAALAHAQRADPLRPALEADVLLLRSQALQALGRRAEALKDAQRALQRLQSALPLAKGRQQEVQAQLEALKQ